MKTKVLLSLIFFLTFFGTVVSQEKVEIRKSNVIEEIDGKSYYIHTVTKGQTLYSIAKAYNVTVDELKFENPELENNNLKIGQKLRIPTINKDTELVNERKQAKFDYFYHIVKKNQTLGAIAKIYNIPERYIRLANPGIKEPLKTGQYIKIPVESSFSLLDKNIRNNNLNLNGNTEKIETGNVSFNPDIKVLENYRHVVKKGETFYSIAKKYGISVNDIKEVNPGLAVLHPGDRLRLPETASAALTKNSTISDVYGKKEIVQKEQTPGYFVYKALKGDNIFKIARKFGVQLDELYELNSKLFNKEIKPGDELRIPEVKSKRKFILYKIPYKTKVKKVAQLFGVSKEQIKLDNPDIKNKLLPGQVVKIKAGHGAIVTKEKSEEENPEKFLSGKTNEKKCVPSPDKSRLYKIALMVPLFLEELDSLDYDEFLGRYQGNFKPFWFVEFIEGAFIAADSLKKQGYNLEFYVYDVDDKVTKTIKTLQTPELKDMDLIIGPFYSNSFDQVALFAENFNIPLVNPFTFREDMTEKYNNIVKVKPGKVFEIPLLQKVIEDRHLHDKIFLITQNSYKDFDLIKKLKDSVISVIPRTVKISNVAINNAYIEYSQRDDEEKKEGFSVEGKTVLPESVTADLFDSTLFDNELVYIDYNKEGIASLEKNGSTVRKNLVIVYGNNKPFIMDVLNRLNVLKDTFDINVVGMPYWETVNRPDYKLYNNFSLTYFSSYYVDTTDYDVKNFIDNFITSYFTYPGKYAFAGYDITWFFAKHLADYDKKFFKCLPFVDEMMMENGFKFINVKSDGNGFENVMWNILKIQDYKVTRLPESDLIPPVIYKKKNED